MKILIVEDDTLLLQGLILAAQTEGYACDGVTTARMAEQSLEAFKTIQNIFSTASSAKIKVGKISSTGINMALKIMYFPIHTATVFF